jgi:parvulin-like peptidyl-prolyl isomerase
MKTLPLQQRLYRSPARSLARAIARIRSTPNVRAATLAWAAVFAFICSASALAEPVLAARVNGAGIPLELLDGQFEERLRERNFHIARLNPARAKALKREALDHLVRIELLWQEAIRVGLAVTEEEVDRAVAVVRTRFQSHDGFVRRIEQGGFTETLYREHTRKVLSGERIAERIVDRDVQVTEQDIAAFYAANPRLFRHDERLKVRHILVAVGPAASVPERAHARGRIEALLERARAGESFEQLARHHSDDATRQWGGELDPFSRGDVPKSFEDAAFALKPGEISAAVETRAGFHLIELLERVPAMAISLQAARERIRGHLRDARGKEAIDRAVNVLRARAKVELLTPL